MFGTSGGIDHDRQYEQFVEFLAVSDWVAGGAPGLVLSSIGSDAGPDPWLFLGTILMP